MVMPLVHENDYAYVPEYGQDAIRTVNAYASFRLIVPVSVTSACSQNMEIVDWESESVNGRGHDDCASLLKLAEHTMKP